MASVPLMSRGDTRAGHGRELTPGLAMDRLASGNWGSKVRVALRGSLSRPWDPESAPHSEVKPHKIQGCRAVGVAGSDAKCCYVVDELGLDACVNYKTPDLDRVLKDACPGGIDVYFDNVGGPVLEAVLRRINRGARIPLVGLIAH
jgi:hypothetical protein